jgi:hypothetical protein
MSFKSDFKTQHTMWSTQASIGSRWGVAQARLRAQHDVRWEGGFAHQCLLPASLSQMLSASSKGTGGTRPGRNNCAGEAVPVSHHPKTRIGVLGNVSDMTSECSRTIVALRFGRPAGRPDSGVDGPNFEGSQLMTSEKYDTWGQLAAYEYASGIECHRHMV